MGLEDLEELWGLRGAVPTQLPLSVLEHFSVVALPLDFLKDFLTMDVWERKLLVGMSNLYHLLFYSEQCGSLGGASVFYCSCPLGCTVK